MSSSNYKYSEIGPSTDLGNLMNKGKTSFWQSSLWAQILSKTHQAKDIFIVSGENHSFLVERRTLFSRYTALYMLGVDTNLSSDCLSFIRNNIVTSDDLFLQIEPLTKVQSAKCKVQSKAPFKRFIEPVTAILDLKTSEEALLASFAEKGRYNIRLAQKRGVTTRWVKASEACNEEGRMKNEEGNKRKTYLEAFFDLLDETTKRDGFAHNTLNYYQHFVETLESHNAGGLLVAEKDGILHAAGIFVYWGNTGIYYYGASSSDREIRRDMATYLLQWDAIREALRRGCETYDFLGISEDGKGKLAGVTEFKLRFNPEKKHWPREYVIIFRPILLKFLQIVSKVRKLIQGR